jgi:hypothetical protein
MCGLQALHTYLPLDRRSGQDQEEHGGEEDKRNRPEGDLASHHASRIARNVRQTRASRL